MKKNKLLFLASLLMLLSVSLTACYDDKADIAFYSGDQLIDQVGTCTNFVSSVTIYTNSSSKTENLGIAYGKGGYQALSSDAEVVKVAYGRRQERQSHCDIDRRERQSGPVAGYLRNWCERN